MLLLLSFSLLQTSLFLMFGKGFELNEERGGKKKSTTSRCIYTSASLYAYWFIFVCDVYSSWVSFACFFFIFFFLKGGREVGFSPSKEDDEKIIIVANNYRV